MKGLFLLIVFFVFNWSVLNAQHSGDAIGIRGGYGAFGYGPEISFQKSLGSTNRLELDLGWRGSRNWASWGLSGIYHWAWNITDGLNWYAGPGAQIGFYSYRNYGPGHPNWDDDYPSSGAFVNIGGQIGLEYDLNQHGVPFQVSIDTRPMWGFINYSRGFGWGGAFGVRYTF
jgi:hypothetical protein